MRMLSSTFSPESALGAARQVRPAPPPRTHIRGGEQRCLYLYISRIFPGPRSTISSSSLGDIKSLDLGGQVSLAVKKQVLGLRQHVETT